MLLKLVNAYTGDLGWMIRAGSIVKWHKTEGAPIHYGDDLFDMKVEEVARHQAALEQANQLMVEPIEYEKWAEKTLQTRNLSVDAIGPESSTLQLKDSFLIRVASSDNGILRRVCAKEGEHRGVGDLLALITTEEGEPVEDSDQGLRDVGIFRIVANMFSPVESKFAAPGQARTFADRNFIMFWSESPGDRRIGIYTKGALCTSPVFACVPLIEPRLHGTCCIMREDQLSFRSDLLLQTLTQLAREWVEPSITRLNLPSNYFQSRLFNKTFTLSGVHSAEEFPATVVVLSIVPDVQNFCFRHKEHGFLIAAEPVYEIDSVEELTWFRDTFVPVGRISVDAFMDNFGRVIDILRNDTGTHVLVLNTFTTVPNSVRHNQQFLGESPGLRRLEFNLALTELSRKHDFSIVDVDRILKRIGTGAQSDWDSVQPEAYLPVAQEMYRTMRDRGVL
jgi:hypothetical protein